MDFNSWLFNTKYERCLNYHGFEDLYLFEYKGKTYLNFSPLPKKGKILDSRIYSYDVDTQIIDLDGEKVEFSKPLIEFLSRVWHDFCLEQFMENFYETA